MLLFLYKTYISEKLLAWFWDLTQHTSINNTTQSYNPSISGLCKRRRMDAMFRKIAKNNPKKWRTQSVQWLTRSQWKDKKYVWTWVNQRVATLLNDIYISISHVNVFDNVQKNYHLKRFRDDLGWTIFLFCWTISSWYTLAVKITSFVY